jgi:predicted chitinase
MLTAAQLKSIMPRLSDTRNGELLPFLTAAMTEFAINTPARTAAFLAQLAHESGQFRFMEEIWGPTDAQRRYEPVTKLSQALGNTEAGDGKRFKGRGPIQLTGRANYQRFGGLLNVDLLADPLQAANPGVAFRVAGLYWSKKGLNQLADVATADAFKEITRRINGGTNGLADRQAFYAVARTALGVAEAPLTRGGEAAPMPADADPTFERGAEAIRSLGRQRPARKPKSTKDTKRAKGTKNTRKAKKRAPTGKAKSSARKKAGGRKKTAATKSRTAAARRPRVRRGARVRRTKATR